MVSRTPPSGFRFASFLSFLFILTILSIGCGGGGGNSASAGLTGGPTPTPTPTPPVTPSSGIVSIKVGDATVPPGGIFQYQLLLTEPKPIGNTSTRPGVPKGAVGPVRGVAVNDASGKAMGVAVIDAAGNPTVKLISPNVTLGTDISYPLFTMTMPVNASVTAGQVFPVTLDAANSIFVDPNNQSYTQEIVGGNLTIGAAAAQSITDVIPGGGLLADRSTIRVLGIGFTQNTRIAIEGTTIFFPGDTTFVNSGEIDVVICNGTVDPAATTCPNTGATFQLDGERVRATNKDTNAVVEYFSYIRTDDMPGASSTTLVTQSHAMFSRQTFVSGTIPYSADATHFTGMALQNAAAVDAAVKVELLDSGSNSLASTSFILTAGKKIVRDIRDWIPSPPAGSATVRVSVTAGPAIQMLGMAGDTGAGTVVPVAVTGQ
jgi:hypothetical protein